ncbi:MAG: Holliday junction DNA helicase RuvB C-terminal domain-containing protein, partial [Rudaea sp.]
GLLSAPLLDRFGFHWQLRYYEPEDMLAIVRRSAHLMGVRIDPDGAREIAPEAAAEIARRSRGTPRIANRLLRRVRDFAEVRAGGRITREVAIAAMEMLKVDAAGFDALDRRLLGTIIDHFDGGPVGVESLAAALSEERGTIEDVLEPYLIQQGFLMRTARGRMVTSKAYRHLGLKPPKRADAVEDLFEDDSGLGARDTGLGGKT